MPHVNIKCFPGRTIEQKELCASKIRDIIVETLGCKPTSLSISIEDINEKDWKDKVWDIDIKDNNNLIIKPGYNCED